jgi:prepilin-type N-terminal cleavage/methylation domain-containing protein
MSKVKISNFEKKRLFQKEGFTILEVLISLSILLITLMVLFQSFSTSIFILSSTKNLWKAISFAQNELLKSERATVSPSVSINQGEFESESEMSGFRWKKFVRDTKPFPGIEIRQINYQLLWYEGKHVYTYDADIYVKPK